MKYGFAISHVGVELPAKQMKSLARVILAAGLAGIVCCGGRNRNTPASTAVGERSEAHSGDSGVLVGGAGEPERGGPNSPEHDAMLEYQKKQIERQRKEMEDLRRQEMYDEKFRRYESQHSK